MYRLLLSQGKSNSVLLHDNPALLEANPECTYKEWQQVLSWTYPDYKGPSNPLFTTPQTVYVVSSRSFWTRRVLHHVSQQDLITSQSPVRPAVASHSSGSPRQQVTENMMVSKAAMKFSQNHPAQHEKLLEVIRTAKAGDSLGHQRASQQGTEKQRQTWSTRMIFNRKVEHWPHWPVLTVISFCILIFLYF